MSLQDGTPQYLATIECRETDLKIGELSVIMQALSVTLPHHHHAYGKSFLSHLERIDAYAKTISMLDP